MSVTVLGCGRSGTNMVLEILRGNSKLSASDKPEDKKLFKVKTPHPKNYLTKCDTVYFNELQLDRTMKINPYMKIIWTIRDPRDMILSKIKRGQPGADGKKPADDATPEGCLDDIDRMFKLFTFARNHYNNRLLLIRMEDVIHDIKSETYKMCRFLEIPFEESMINFTPRMRNKFKKQRYNELDKGQLCLWKNWRNIYDGFYKTNVFPIEGMFDKVNYLVDYFKYEK